MIRVVLQPEPAIFEEHVRRPGQAFLGRNPNPTLKQFNTHSYWRRILKPLHTAYNGICAYSCHWIPYDTGCDTVEHFLSKKARPNQAYEWSNYRLVCGTLNGRKGEFDDVLDPFLVNNGDFVLRFPSLLVAPSTLISREDQTKVQTTINRLQLALASVVLITTQFEDTPYEVTLPRVPWLRQQCYINVQSIQPVKFTEFVRRAPGKFDTRVIRELKAALKRWLKL
jgi:hypothetical protein